MRYLLIFMILCTTAIGYSQNIKFKITGFEKDTTVHLVRYFGKGLYYADTAEIKKGVVEFNGAKQKPGILALFFPDQKMLEFIYDNNDVHIEANYPNLLATTVVKKSENNRIFAAYANFMNTERQRANLLVERRKTMDQNSDDYKKLSAEIDETTQKVIDYQKSIVKEHGDEFVGKIVKMSMDIEVPDPPKDAEGNIIDSNFRFKYYREHYFDNIDFQDDRLVNTPIFHSKLSTYFGKSMMIQHWDTVIHYAFKLCDQLNPTSDTYQYTVSWITSTYEKSNIMGMDKVFVEMANRYYCGLNESGEPKAFWMNTDEKMRAKLDKLCEKAETQKNLVMGVRPPNLILRDTTDVNWKDFYSLDAEYTILYFWDPECGHCKKITPKLQTLYAKKFKERNIEIFAVGKAVGDEFDKWKAFVKKHNLEFINVAVTDKLFTAALEDPRQFVPKYTTLESLNYQKTYDIFSTPRVFVLDKDKKIIGKSLSVSQLEDMLDRLQGKDNVEKIFPESEENPEDSQMH